MSKSKKIVIAVLAVLLVISGAFAVITSNSGIMGVLFGGVKSVPEKKLEDVNALSLETDYPLVQMQDKSFFYEPFPDGTFKFYKFEDGSFKEVTDVKTKSVSLEVSYQKLNVKLHYIKTGKGNEGFGLYNSGQSGDVKLLSYVFVRMMKCPESFKSAAKTDYILLADRTGADAYKPNKTYSEMYSFNLDSGKASLVINQRDRTVQEDGTANEGWTIFTDNGLNTQKKKDLFASTRVNDNRAEDKLYCLMTIANASERIKSKGESATVTNCVSPEFREKDNAYYCLVKTDSGFDIVKNGDKKNPVHSFDGSISGYVVSGNLIYNRATNEVTDFFTGETTALKLVTSAEISGVAASKDGKKIAVFANGEKKQTMAMYNTEDGSVEAVTDKLFNSGICNFCFIDSDCVMFSDYYESGAAVNTVVRF